MRNRSKQLILFDIDGTLINPGPSGRKLLNLMVKDISNCSPKLKYEDVAGFTDPIIVEQALRRTGVKENVLSSKINEILEDYPKRLKKIYNNDEGVFVYNDAIKFAKACKVQGWEIGLLSGNVRKAAKIKLDRFNLWQMFPFGLFGDDARSREDLVWLAEEASWISIGESFTHDRMVLVGDTVHDVSAAKLNNVRSLIVCRYPERFTDIQKVGPTWLVNSLKNTERIVQWLKVE
tara:strand:+ start:24612 stop:25313 length:702 start_codon:yes stop_codon:yes gene_type:complete